MKRYGAIIKIFFKTQLVWRFDVIFNMIFTVIKILFAFILWGAIFGQKKIVAGFTYNQMLSYYIICSFLSQLDNSGAVSREISDKIRNGMFSKYMIIPVNIQRYFIAQSIGVKSFYLIFDLIAAGVWVVIFRIKFTVTTDLSAIVFAIILVVLGLLFMIQLNYFIGILTLKFENIDTFLMIKDNIIAFITGSLIPLALLSDGVIKVMRIFPFYYISYLPSMLFIGKNVDEALTGIALLSMWVIIFIPINRCLYKTLRTKFDGVGI